jgi:hypothetical protein
MHFTIYTLDVPIINPLGLIIPKSIILKGTKITITFDNGNSHVIHYAEDVELFYREKEKDGRDIQTDTNKKAISRGKNPTEPRTA